MNLKVISTIFLGALLVTGCGGGGGGGSGSGGNPPSGLSISTSPTATFTSSQADADTLAKEIQNGTPDLVAAVSMQNIPAGISTLPAGVSGSYPCSNLSSTGIGSGSMTYDTNMPSSGTPTAGTYVNMTFSSCTFDVSSTTTFTLNGSSKVTYTRFNSYSDYATSVSYSNFTMSIVDTSTSTNDSYGPISGSYVLDVSGGTITIATQLPNGGVTNLLVANVSYSGNNVTINSATYVYNSPGEGGIIKVEFNGWTYDSTTGIPISGTITVTDANGDTVVITALAGNVTVTYNINNTTTAYTVTFP